MKAGALVAGLLLVLAAPPVAAESVSGAAGTWESAFASTGPLAGALDRLGELNGVSRDRFRVDPAALELEMTYGGRFRLQNYVMREPLRAPGTLQSLARELRAGDGVAPRLALLARLARSEGHGGPDVPPEAADTAAAPAGVEPVMEEVFRGTGQRFQGNDRDRLRREAATLPEEVLRPLEETLIGVLEAAHRRDAVVKGSDFRQGGAFDMRSRRTARDIQGFLAAWGDTAHCGEIRGQDLVKVLESADRDELVRGGETLAKVLDRVAAVVGTRGFGAGAPEAFQYEWQTPIGRVAVGGRGANTYEGTYALVFDLGGDDSYRGPGSVSGVQPVSVVVDLGGDDRYAPADSATAGPGGALLGYAAVVDLGGGKDAYEGDAWGAGFGFLGVGWIRDDGGDDTYRMRWLSEGAGYYGLGLLLDEGGNDRYALADGPREFTAGNAQGFGGPAGIGLLLDLEGDDVHEGAPGAGAGAAGGSYLQGASRGTGSHRAGGLGLLVDWGGKDTYIAGDRSQGAARGAGLGALVDLAGDDVYRAGLEAQGAGLDSGAGLLVDGAGNDTYAVGRSGLGGGVNLGMGMLVDLDGDDSYRSTGYAGGVTREHGAGWFLDLAGKDDYGGLPLVSKSPVDPPTRRPWLSQVPAVAVFVDLDQMPPGVLRAAPLRGWNLVGGRVGILGGVVGGPAASTGSEEAHP